MSKVSIIVPTYNVEQYLVECMESIVNQTLKDIEIICVDDGSTDNSGKILDEYAAKDNRIKVIHKENGGYGKAMNIGLDNATGEYIGIVEPDDYVALDMYEELYNVAKENDLEMVKSDFYRYSTNPETKNIYFSPCNKKGIYNKIICPLDYTNVFNGSLSIWAAIYNRKFLNKNMIRFLETPGASFQDTGFGLKVLFDAQKVLFLDKALYHYRVDNANSSVKNNSKVFCICDELYELEKRYKYSSEKIKKMINTLKIDKYTWNYNRLAEEGRASFYKIYNTELRNIIQSHNYVENFIPETIISNAKNILGIIENPTLKENNIIQKIFSVKNNRTKTHKVITIFGLKIKIKRNVKYKNYNSFLSHRIKQNTVLLVELNTWHGECLPGIAKYFIDLGYNVDVIMRKEEALLDPFKCFDNNINLFSMDLSDIKRILTSAIVSKYKHLYINSYMMPNSNIKKEFENKLKCPSEKLIIMCHDTSYFDEIKFQKNIEVTTLVDFSGLNNKKYTKINPHFYKSKSKFHNKNKTVKFIVVGNIEAKRKNHNLLIDTVSKLLSENITNFKIVVISRIGNLEIPNELKSFFEIKGRLSYKKMYEELEKADFFLTLFDTDNVEHNRYLTTGASGSYQLIYGFNLPCLLPHKFQADINGFNNQNSIGYADNNHFCKAMKMAIQMTDERYQEYKNNLKILQKEIYKSSLNNLKKILKGANYKHELICWYKRITNKELNLDNPRTFNEKIQWLKLYDSTPIKTRLADKYLVRDWVKEQIGEEYLIPLLGVYDNFDEINFDKLPNQFVIKCNHGSGYNIIVKDKSTLDIENAREKVNKWMNENYAFKIGCELHYRNIPHKIIIEQFLDEISNNLYDYRFFCCNGKVEQIWLDVGSGTPEHKRKIYDKNWNELAIKVQWPRLETNVPKPKNLQKMIKMSEKMSKEFALVRVDFYDVNNKIYFGEMTFTTMSGIGQFEPKIEDLKLGKKIKLPKLAYNIDTGEYYKLPNYKLKRFLQNIFSVKNSPKNKKHKIITILGLKIKIKRKRK